MFLQRSMFGCADASENRTLFPSRYFCSEDRIRSARTIRNVIVPDHRLCAVMREDRKPHSRLVAGCIIGSNPVNTVVIDLAFGIVAAEDADSERIAHVVSFHHCH